jgi:hypothetical protein
MDLKLDKQTHDLVIEGGDLVFVDGAEDVVQSIKIRLLTLAGEWFLDDTIGWITFAGMPFGKVSNLSAVRARILQEITGTPGVLSAEITAFSLIPSTRNLSVTYRARVTDGFVNDSVEVTL